MNTKRNTIQRRLIFNAVKELDIHATAEQVYEHVAKGHPSLSRATVYRNLRQMEEAGELLDIGNFMGATHYDHNLFRHGHFICDGCGRVFDVGRDLPEIAEPPAGLEGFKIKGRSLTFSGLCPECNLKSDAVPPVIS